MRAAVLLRPPLQAAVRTDLHLVWMLLSENRNVALWDAALYRDQKRELAPTMTMTRP
jgi:hypothetical protein